MTYSMMRTKTLLSDLNNAGFSTTLSIRMGEGHPKDYVPKWFTPFSGNRSIDDVYVVKNGQLEKLNEKLKYRNSSEWVGSGDANSVRITNYSYIHENSAGEPLGDLVADASLVLVVSSNFVTIWIM